MTGDTKHIITKIFQANSLEDVSVRLLEELVEQNPSFGMGHYLLSQKLQQQKDPSFKEQVQKTGLYFTKPYWLEWLLKNNGEGTVNHIVGESPLELVPLSVEVKQPIDTEQKEEKIATATGSSTPEQTISGSTEIKEEVLVFEPYHTIDYFASQGIKFTQEMNPQDRLGKQLKSFTEWLKIMKKLPQKTTESILDEKTRDIIETEAADSLLAKEVLTETMAEVLIKQGKIEDAAEVYRKLSLHYPAKSVYFAAKIEQLKVQ